MGEQIVSSARTFSLAGRVTVVTGAGSGIGQALTVGMAEAGADVVLVDINDAGIAETTDLVRGSASPSCDALGVRCDVSNEEEVLALFDRVHEHYGRVDVLVNCAFTPVLRRPQDLDLGAWQRVLDVNLTGYFLCARSAGRSMIARGAGGSIINLSSIAGVSGLGRGNFAYSISKGGIVQMTRELAVEWGRYGIRVNAILPVQTRTKGFQARLDDPITDAGFLDRLVSSVPLRRIGEPEDFVGPAVFLASDAAAMVSGVMLPVDGGNLAMNAGARSDE
jgi:NAD(P)-dependent dehydrogenase (short-subunit alcohol dehydrogenase family)